jgi:regulator of sigma E protease
VARRRKADLGPLIGIAPPERLVLEEKRHLKGRDRPAFIGSAADRATPPFEFEDTIIGVTGGDQREKKWKKEWYLPLDPRNTQKEQPDFFAFQRQLRLLEGKVITVRVRRQSGEEVSILVPPAYHQTFGLPFGLRMEMGQVAAVRRDSPAAKGDVKDGDIIEQVEVEETNGTPTVFAFPAENPAHPWNPAGKLIDPTRLPFELRQWADRRDRALAARAAGTALSGSIGTGPWGPLGALVSNPGKVVTLRVRRPTAAKDKRKVTLTLPWDDNPQWRFDREVPFSPSSPLAIAELGLGYKVMGKVALDPSREALRALGAGTLAWGASPLGTVSSSLATAWNRLQDQKLRPGDVIKQVRFWKLNKEGEPEADSWNNLEEPDQWAHIFWVLQLLDIKKIDVKVNDSPEEITLEAGEDRTWPLASRGLWLSSDRRMQKADSMLEAVEMGLSETGEKVKQVYTSLRAIVTGRISVKNLGGPITIAKFAYVIAGENFWEFVFFLGMISINLAVVNFLPIPVLDGGHMVFLTYEKIRGKRPSESVQVALTLMGLAFIILLFIFVSFLDLTK